MPITWRRSLEPPLRLPPRPQGRARTSLVDDIAAQASKADTTHKRLPGAAALTSTPVPRPRTRLADNKSNKARSHYQLMRDRTSKASAPMGKGGGSPSTPASTKAKAWIFTRRARERDDKGGEGAQRQHDDQRLRRRRHQPKFGKAFTQSSPNPSSPQPIRPKCHR